MLKIAYVLGYFPAISETFIVNQINSTIDQGNEVHIYAYKKGSNKNLHQSHLTHNLIDKTTYFIKKPKHMLGRYVGFFRFVIQHFQRMRWNLLFQSVNLFKHGRNAYTLNLFYEAQWFVLKGEHDLIHAHFGHIGQRIARLKSYGFLQDVPLITTFHGFDLVPNQTSFYKEKYNWLWIHANRFTVNTPYLEGVLKQVAPSHIPITLLPVGLDTHAFQPDTQSEKHKNFTLIFCGRLIALKGAHLAVDIVNNLVQKGYNELQLRIIGTGSEYERLQEMIKQFGLEENIHLLGAKTQKQVKIEMQQAHALILPGMLDPTTGRAETQGLVIQEAAAMQLPVIVSDVGGMKYGLLPGETGFVVKAGDVKAFEDAVIQLIEDPTLAETMGRKGRTLVVDNYDNTVLQRKLIDIYTEVLHLNDKTQSKSS